MASIVRKAPSGQTVKDAALCRPVTTSYFEVENRIVTNGISAEIRHFAWEHSCDAQFEADGYYIDYSLGPRSHGARLRPGGGRDAVPFGEVAFIPKGARFAAQCAPSEFRVLCLTFEDWAATHLFENHDLPPPLPPCFDVKAPWVRQGLARLADEVNNPGFAHEALVQTIALTLVVDLTRYLQGRELSDETINSRISDWRLRRLKDRIRAGLAGPLSIPDLAEECGLSPRHLMRTFKNTVGTTISSYIADARIEQAKRELMREDALIKVVASNCGFQSASAFSAAFRKATGLSPRHFREEMFFRAR